MQPGTRALWLIGGIPFAVALVVASCSDDPPGAGGDGTTNVTSYCGTPNDGCACAEPGKKIPCGKVEQRSANHILCSEGSRTCTGGNWSSCTSDTIKTLDLRFGSGSLRPLALGAAASSCSGVGTGVGLCAGGALAGTVCLANGVCPGGACVEASGACVGGAQAGNLCTGPAGCPGGTCTTPSGVCIAGAQDSNACAVAGDCPGGTCSPGWGGCAGGPASGSLCLIPAQCPGGTCHTSAGNNPCDPYCNQYTDDCTGADAGAAGCIDGGLTIPTGPSPDGGAGAACVLPADPAATYCNSSNGFARNRIYRR